jgi:hypothetical protein
MVNLSINNPKVNLQYICEGENRGAVTVPALFPGYRPSIQVRQAEAYRDWLSVYPWTHFLTLTFKPSGPTGSCHPERADKIFRKALDEINKAIWGKRYKKQYRKGVIVARAVEKGKKGGLLHYHAVMGRVPDYLNCEFLEKVWQDVGGGFCRIEKVKSPKDVVQYMAKGSYLFKHGEIDFFPQGNQAFWWSDLGSEGQPLLLN